MICRPFLIHQQQCHRCAQLTKIRVLCRSTSTEYCHAAVESLLPAKIISKVDPRPQLHFAGLSDQSSARPGDCDVIAIGASYILFKQLFSNGIFVHSKRVCVKEFCVAIEKTDFPYCVQNSHVDSVVGRYQSKFVAGSQSWIE